MYQMVFQDPQWEGAILGVELIEMPFWGLSYMGPWNHVLDEHQGWMNPIHLPL